MKSLGNLVMLMVAAAFLSGEGVALAQGDRMDDYQRKLEKKLDGLLKARGAATSLEREKEAKEAGVEQSDDLKEKKKAWREKRDEKIQAKVNLNDSDRGDAKDVEIRLDMPLEDFEEFAPKAACEASSIPHKFETNYIFLRHTKTGRTGRVGMADAEKIGADYAAGNKDAVDEMARKINWH
jgi:hypothetical protein